MSNDPRKFKTGIAVTGTATVGGDTVTTNTASQTLVNKTIDADSNTISNIDNADIKVGAAIDAAKIHNGSVSNTEFGYLDGVTSSIQTQLNTAATGLSDHLSDATDAHDASAISSVPAGNLAATDVQGALNELQSDIDSRALDSAVIKKDGSVAFTAAQSMGGFKLTSLASPTTGSDAANKSYVDAVAEGLKPKTAARVATTANIVIATALNSGDTLDGVTLANGDRVLVKDQTAAEENGIYVVSATPTRATDFDSLSPIDEINGSIIAIQEGTANAGKIFVQQGTVAVLDTDPINFVFFNSSSSLVGGDGITVSGSNISVDHDGQGLTFVATQLALELDGSTLSKSASGIKVADLGIANAQVSNSAAIAYSKLNLSSSIVNADIAAAAAIDATKLADGSVSNTEFQYLDGVTSSIQTQLNDLASSGVSGAIQYSDGAGGFNADASQLLWSGTQLSVGTNTAASGAIATFANGNGTNTVFNNSLSGTAEVSLSVDDSTSGIGTTTASDFEVFSNLGSGGGYIVAKAAGGIELNANGGTIDATTHKIVNLVDPTNLQDAATKAYVDSAVGGSAGDIAETSFSLANNQASPANVTGLAFANATVRSFKALVSVEIDATADLFESFELLGVQRGADWSMSFSSTGDDSLVSFSITTSGQVQYTSGTYAGFASGKIKFTAITTTVG